MEELRRMREEAGFTQVGLAKASGVDRATINKIEQGHRSPTIETLEKLAGALAVEMGDFFPKAQPRLPMLPDSPAAGAVADEEQRLQYLRAWRIYIHRLARRWEEEPPQTSEEIDPTLGALVPLLEQGVFDLSGREGPSEAQALALILDGLGRLAEIAQKVEQKAGQGSEVSDLFESARRKAG